MADQASVTILWARRVKQGSTRAGALELGVRVKNTGTVAWTSGSRNIRGHVITGSGVFFRDVAVSSAALASSVAVGNSIDQVVRFCGDPATSGLLIEDLFRPDTLIVVDIVQENVAWLGNPPGSIYVRDADRDTSQILDAAPRLGLAVRTPYTASVPTTGSPAVVFDLQPAAGTTLYVLGLVLTADTAPQRLEALYTPAGGEEGSYAVYQVSNTASLPVDMHRLRIGAGERLRLMANVNAAGGTVNVHADSVLLPWAE